MRHALPLFPLPQRVIAGRRFYNVKIKSIPAAVYSDIFSLFLSPAEKQQDLKTRIPYSPMAHPLMH